MKILLMVGGVMVGGGAMVGTIVNKKFLNLDCRVRTILMFENRCVPFKTGYVNRGRLIL